MNEVFSLTKFVKSFGQWLPWAKTARYAIGIGLIVLFGFMFYKTFFVKNQEQKIEKIVVEKGGTFIGQQQSSKKHWYLFTEPYVFIESDDRVGVGIRGGVRWEF